MLWKDMASFEKKILVKFFYLLLLPLDAQGDYILVEFHLQAFESNRITCILKHFLTTIGLLPQQYKPVPQKRLD